MKPEKQLRLNITDEELNDLPLKSYEGEIVLLTQPDQLEETFQEISEHSVVGFDTETKPVFVKGQFNDVALIQIALPEKVFLVRLKHTGVHNPIIQFLENSSIIKAGIALRDDVAALNKLKAHHPAGFLDLTTISRKLGIQVESVKKLTALLLGFRISKRSQTSNWDAQVLNEGQLLYAATDAWVCLKIYEELRKLEG